ncbi:MAG: rhomboid family intramembrane serine protease [Bradymonadaceae bacterium]
MSEEADQEAVGGPEAYLDAISRQLRLARIMEQPVVVTWWLLAANVLIWVAGVAVGWTYIGDGLGLSSQYLNYEQLTLYSGMKVNRLMEAGQWWRLFSSQFVHLNLMHIVFNAYGLYVLGPILERFYGRKRFFTLYLASGTLGAWASYSFNAIPSGGASGAIYGLVGGLLVFGFKYRDSLPDRLSRALTVGLLPWVILSLGIGFIESIPMDNAAHVGGLVAGAALAVVLDSRVRGLHSRGSEWLVWASTLVGVCALVWTTAHWSDEQTHCLQSKEEYLSCYPELSEALGEGKLEVPDDGG